MIVPCQGDHHFVMSCREDVRQQNCTSTGLACESCKRSFDLIAIMNERHHSLHFKSRNGVVDSMQEIRPTAGRCLRIEQERNAREGRGNLRQQLHPLSSHRGLEIGESGDVTARMREARDESLADRVRYRDEYDWNAAGLTHKGCHDGTGACYDKLTSQLDQLFGELPYKDRIVGSPAVINGKVAILRPP